MAGGTRGVGRATARAARVRGLPGRGARAHTVATSARPRRSCSPAAPSDAIGLECNLLDTGEVEAAFTFLDERWGECHVLVNTVGPAHVGGLDDLTDAAWLDEFDLGVLTMIRTTRAALPLHAQGDVRARS